MSLDVLPFIPFENVPNNRGAHSVFLGEFSGGHLPRHIKLSYLYNFLVCQFVGCGIFALWKSVFLSSIDSIVRPSSKKHVVRIYAQCIVPSRAVVAYAKTIWDWAFNKLPSFSMRQNELPFPKAVSVSIFGCSAPYPAGISLVDTGPKSSPWVQVTLSTAIQKFEPFYQAWLFVKRFPAGGTWNNHLIGILLKPQTINKRNFNQLCNP